MQYKIPQEVNVEDKIIGPFTLKGFAFFMVFIIFTILLTAIFSSLGMSFFTAIIFGGLISSPIMMLGFIPFNGRPLYTYTESFLNYFLKPRKRTWKREVEKKPSQNSTIGENVQNEEQVNMLDPIEAESNYVPPKENVEMAERKMEEIALMVDTGGAYGQPQAIPGKDPKDIFNTSSSGRLESDLAKAKEEVESRNKTTEPTVADMASVDPSKKFDYDKADTSEYKIGEIDQK